MNVMKTNSKRRNIPVAIIGIILIAVILMIGTVLTGQKAKQDTEKATNSVSLLYLDELAGRREQVVSSALKKNITDLQTAVGLMTAEDLSDTAHLQAYQARMKKLYTLEKFAFVDTNGLIYTSLGTQNNIGDYNIDYNNISEPQISIKGHDTTDKRVIIAVPLDNISLGEKSLQCALWRST